MKSFIVLLENLWLNIVGVIILIIGGYAFLRLCGWFDKHYVSREYMEQTIDEEFRVLKQELANVMDIPLTDEEFENTLGLGLSGLCPSHRVANIIEWARKNRGKIND